MATKKIKVNYDFDGNQLQNAALDSNSTINGYKLVVLTAAEYNALATKDESTIYLIKGTVS